MVKEKQIDFLMILQRDMEITRRYPACENEKTYLQSCSLNLIDYKIYAYGKEYTDDQFDEVIAAVRKADTIVMGSPLYWHNICGLMRNFLDRCYGPIGQGEFSGKKLYFIMQGASPEKWQLEACDFTMSRFAGLYGLCVFFFYSSLLIHL